MTKKELRKQKKELIEQLSLLQAGRLLLDDKKNWTKGVLARDGHNFEVQDSGQDATCWCGFGGLGAFDPPLDTLFAAQDRLDKAVPGGSFPEYNDVDRRRHHEVIAKFDRVIEEVSQEIDALPV
jgi:hypothetical protein